ncbi:MAG TPA: hypothetical protein VKG80_07615 [Trebonia sp.]|nr:hypothetical protein [Trebonia sp.]
MADPVSRVSRVLVRGPLAPFAGEYRSELLARGYTPRTAVNQLRQMSRLSCRLGDLGLEAVDVREGLISEFLAFQRAGGRHRSQWPRPGPMCLLDVLRRVGAASAPQSPAMNGPGETSFSTPPRYCRHS